MLVKLYETPYTKIMQNDYFFTQSIGYLWDFYTNSTGEIHTTSFYESIPQFSYTSVE